MIEKIKRFFFKEPTTWFTSDLHFGHRNVINYCNRPYKDLEEMHKALIKIWNDTVKEGDTVYVLGDFSLNKKWSQTIIPLLKGNKILISGNHDYCFDHPPKENSGLSIQQHRENYKRRCDAYIQHGWQAVHQTLKLKFKNGVNVLLHHLPYATPKEVGFDQRYLNLRPKDEGLFLLHGHLHGRYKKYKNMIDCGLDAWNLNLISEDDIIKIIESKENYIKSSLTDWYETNKS